ncbi:MAG: cyclic nucleotide-binding domain-containing protein [Candidatus Rokubacteria bacterium]|nr:cyclic nucleotide-binding domain-containing protein [Candidatus Rokubacteria bacterium]
MPVGSAPVRLTIDGRPVEVLAGTSIFDAARTLGIAIPTLCHQQNQTPVAVCRVCAVEVKNARVYAAACIRPVEPNMEVLTGSPEVERARRTLLELLLADHPVPCGRQLGTEDCELETLAHGAGLATTRFGGRPAPLDRDLSHPNIAVDHSACILCDRCIRGCSEVQANFVIGRRGKGYGAGIAFDADVPMGKSSCVSCGECLISCPTGALTLKKEAVVVAGIEPVDKLPGELLTPEDVRDIPIFRGVSGSFLELNRGSVAKRTFEPGEVICREGEYGSTAFYILKGKVDIFLATPLAHSASRAVGSKGGLRAALHKVTGLLSQREDPREESAATAGFIPIDASVDLAYGRPSAQLGPGELFGEMTCLSFYPRSATVRAAEETVVLEMLRNVLQILQRNKTFRAQLERTYRDRALATHLRSVSVLSGVTTEFLGEIRERVELLTFEPGEVIVRQGDPADSFYLIRIGFVKVSQRYPGGELVLAYLSRGNYFGEMGLLGGGVRTATCTALDHVEVVRMRGEDFALMVERFPDIRRGLGEAAAGRAEENRRQASRLQDVPMDEFLRQGLMEAQNLLVLDLERCTRCDACVRACADAHDGVTRLIRDGLRYDKYLVATSCRQCRDPLCMIGCPVGSIRRRNSLEVIIEDWCIGCGRCAEQCPYGNINMHPFRVSVDDPAQPGRRKAAVRLKATGCDLCTELAEPSCVYACPHGAAMRVEPREFFASGTSAARGAPPSIRP